MNWLRRPAAPQYAWVLALLIPLFAVQVALTTPIEEHAFDAAAFHVFRGVAYADAAQGGTLYPRWIMSINGGMGGPIFNFYSPLAYFLMATAHSVGVPVNIGWRLLVAAGLLFGAAGMFLLGRALFKRSDCALVATAAFTYAPYLLRDLFERGSPQGIALAFLPWVLWALLRLAERPSGLSMAIAALCMAAMILMHNLSALLLLPVIAVMCLYLALRFGVRAASYAALALILGIMLAALHVLPYAFDSKFVAVDNSLQETSLQPASYSVQPGDLLALPAIFDTGIDNNATGFSLGPLHWLALCAGLLAAIVLWRRGQKHAAFLIGALCLLALLLIWMQTDSATFVWRAITGLTLLQFRVRLLAPIGLIAGLALGYMLLLWPSRLERWRGAVLVALVAALIGLQLPSLYPALQHRYIAFSPDPSVQDMQDWYSVHSPGTTLTTVGELLPRWRTARFSNDEVARAASSPLDNLPADATVSGTVRSAAALSFMVQSSTAFTAAVHLLYFPGWKGSVNGQPQSLQPMDATDYTLIALPAGTSTVTFHYDGTDAQHAGDLLSLVTALALLSVAILWRSKSASGTPVQIEYSRPRWWLVAGIVLLISVKGVWLDPDTTLLRRTSSCGSIQGADVQTAVIFTAASDSIRLCGYSIAHTSNQPGDPFRVTLYWQIDKPIENLNSFVHLLGSAFNPATNNPLWGQQDKQTPGTLATSDWIQDKLYQDTYDFTVDPHTPAGNYQLEIGWTNASGQRSQPEIEQASASLSVSDLHALLISGIEIR